jgi:SAM-dependent methyltransferase
MANEEFGLPRLAAIYDLLDSDRRDLDLYLGLARDFGIRSALDIGCGTGVLALRLAELGLDVTAVDPAAASLAVARAKPGADRVTWLLGDVNDAPPAQRDLVLMTGNTAQQLVDDESWHALLERTHVLLDPAGHLVFETRDPTARAWETWTRDATTYSTDLPGIGSVETWTQVTDVRLPFISFRSSWTFASDGATLTSDSTIRFRSLAEVHADLTAAGFTVLDVLDAPDRPGQEFVFVAVPSTAT